MPWPKVTWGRKNTFGLHVSFGVHHWGKLGSELKQEQGRNQGNAAYWFTLWLLFSVSFLLRPRPACLGMALLVVGWTQPHRSPIKTVSHRHNRKQFPHWDFLSAEWSLAEAKWDWGLGRWYIHQNTGCFLVRNSVQMPSVHEKLAGCKPSFHIC